MLFFESMLSMLSVMVGRIIFSRVLAIGERRKICLYEVLMLIGLLCLGMGIILATFQMVGI